MMTGLNMVLDKSELMTVRGFHLYRLLEKFTARDDSRAIITKHNVFRIFTYN